MADDDPQVYIRVERGGRWITLDARDATETEFRAWLLRLLARMGAVVTLRADGDGHDG